jgi:hypothetical protein
MTASELLSLLREVIDFTWECDGMDHTVYDEIAFRNQELSKRIDEALSKGAKLT